MHLPPDAAQRFSDLISAVWTAMYYSRREWLERAGISPTRRSAFERAFKRGKSPLHLSEVRRVIDVFCSDPVLRLDAEVVWSWVMGEIAKPAAVQELLLSLALQVKRLPMHVPVLADFEAVAKLQIAFATVPKLSTLPGDVVKVIHWNCTRPLGASADLMCSFLNRFWRLRAQARSAGHQCPARQILLHCRSDLLQLRDGTGLFAGLAADERADALRTYIDDAIMLRGNEVGVIDDGNIPRHLFDHFRKFDALFILDVDHLYKVHRGGLLRTTCEASDDIRSAFIANEAAMLWELKRYVSHGWTKTAMKQAMMPFMPR